MGEKKKKTFQGTYYGPLDLKYAIKIISSSLANMGFNVVNMGDFLRHRASGNVEYFSAILFLMRTQLTVNSEQHYIYLL